MLSSILLILGPHGTISLDVSSDAVEDQGKSNDTEHADDGKPNPVVFGGGLAERHVVLVDIEGLGEP